MGIDQRQGQYITGYKALTRTETKEERLRDETHREGYESERQVRASCRCTVVP